MSWKKYFFSYVKLSLLGGAAGYIVSGILIYGFDFEPTPDFGYREWILSSLFFIGVPAIAATFMTMVEHMLGIKDK